MAEAALLSLSMSELFESCYREHFARVFRWSLRYAGGNASWAEDLAHDVFVKLFEHMDELRDPGDAGGWLYRTTANLAVTRIRRERSWLQRISRAWRAEQPEDSPALDAEMAAGEEAKAALAALEKLPPKERVVVCMRLLDGKSQREIADALGLSEGYVSKLMARALDRVRAIGWLLEEKSDG
jgi:RNA polymerase sigma factor (sigma-70 family)